MDTTTIYLFSGLPRQVAPPYRRKIFSFSELLSFFSLSNTHEIFTSVYSFFEGKITIDKIFIDIDGGYTEELYNRFCLACENLNNSKIPFIPVVSGIKGFHLYIPLIPKEYENNQNALNDLYYATHSIISEAGLYDIIVEDNIKKVNIIPDKQIIGDIHRICRIPNSIRSDYDRSSFCTYLPQEFFKEMSLVDVISHMKSCHSYTYDFKNLKSIEDTIRLGVKYDLYSMNHKNNTQEVFEQDYDEDDMLTFLRPILKSAISVRNPTHIARVASTTELIYLGYSDKEIIEFYRSLDWIDFDESRTTYHVREVRGKKLLPFSNSKLQYILWGV